MKVQKLGFLPKQHRSQNWLYRRKKNHMKRQIVVSSEENVA